MRAVDPEHLAFLDQRSDLKAQHAAALDQLHDLLAWQRTGRPFSLLSDHEQGEVVEDAFLLCITCDEDGGSTTAVKASEAARALVAEQYRIGRAIADLEARMLSSIGRPSRGPLQ